MEIAKISDLGIKIKSKTALLGINPTEMKSPFDAALFLQRSTGAADSSIEGETIIIKGPGEYEIKGVKITGVGKGEDLGYVARIEGISVFVVKASSLTKSKELMEDCQILVLAADTPIEESLVAASGAQAVVVLGEHAQAVAKVLGKEVVPVAKYVVTKDKLPTETEVTILN